MQDNEAPHRATLGRAIGFIEGFADDATQEGVGELLEGLVKLNDTALTRVELATVRAAVQAYHDLGMADPASRLSYLGHIASNQNTIPPLSKLGVCALLEKLDRMAEPSVPN